MFSSLLFFICQLRLLEPKYFNIEEIQALILFFFCFFLRKTVLVLTHRASVNQMLWVVNDLESEFTPCWSILRPQSTQVVIMTKGEGSAARGYPLPRARVGTSGSARHPLAAEWRPEGRVALLHSFTAHCT